MSSSGSGRAARHVVFVGGMAAGKSSAARGLAERLRRPVRDNDEQLEAATGQEGHEVAAREGVAALHQAEASHLLDALASPEPTVVAAAASVVESDRCLEALRGADVVWLRVSPKVAGRRLGGPSHRRALGPDPVATLRALANRRDARYERAADLTIDVDDLETADVVALVLDWLDRRAAGQHDGRNVAGAAGEPGAGPPRPPPA